MDGAEGPEPDFCESGATGLELTISSICPGIALRCVEGPRALSSLSYIVNWLSCVDFMLTDTLLGVGTYRVQNNRPPGRKRLPFPLLLGL